MTLKNAIVAVDMRHIIPNLKEYSNPLVDVPKNIYTSASLTYSKTWLIYFF